MNIESTIARHEFRAMGCQMLAGLEGQPDLVARCLEQVPDWFETWEQALSRFREDSELNQLNRLTGQPVPVSQILWDVLQSAYWAYTYSQGLVTPAVLDAMVSIGYERSFAELTTSDASPQTLLTAKTRSFANVRLDPDNRTVTLPEGMHLDFGGVAKGWAAQQAMQRLKTYGSALVDAGGDIAISECQSNGEPWVVGIEDPFAHGEDYDVLLLGRCGVATSGTDFRRWQQNGVWRHHIIDPRTGQPAESDLISVTVVAPTVIQAEAATKIILISGSREGMAWLERQSDLAGILVLENRVRLYSQKIKPYLWR
jgi:thiamine biosynthesis lipoprotein